MRHFIGGRYHGPSTSAIGLTQQYAKEPTGTTARLENHRLTE